jgi:apolipoprotein N-acyltransferase
MRAIEQSVPVVRAANTGVSAIISPTGEIKAEIKYGVKGLIDESLQLYKTQKTIYSSRGVYLVLLVIFFSVLFSVFYRKN